MNLFTWNLLLALLWAAVTANFAPLNLLFGFIVGYAALWFVRSLFGDMKYHPRLWWTIALIAFFLKELVKSSVRVAIDVLTPSFTMRPGVIGIPLDVTSNMEITLLANMISLTPGTLSLDVSDDRSMLYIHAMYVDTDADAIRHEIKEGFERRIMRVTR